MLTRTEDSMPQSANPFVSNDGPALAIPNFPAILRRQWRSVMVGCLVGLTLAIVYILLATPLYESVATIMIDTRMNQILQKQDIISDTPVDTSLVDSQVEVLTSESIALAVIRKFNLTHDSEFVGPPSHLGAQILWNIKVGIANIKKSLGVKDDVAADPQLLLERAAVQTFSERLKVTRTGLTYVIEIAYRSEDPAKAARIANAVAETYMGQELEARYASTRRAGAWLQERLSELKGQATEADRVLQTFKSANNIVDTGHGLLDQQQLSDLQTQLTTAKAATSEAKARLDRIRDASNADLPNVTVTDALSNSVITRLRSQYLDLAAREADLSARLGKTHIAAVKLRGQMDEIRNSVRNEVQRIADAYASDYQIALSREKSLSDSMSHLLNESGANSQAQVKMRDLQSSSDAYRTLYDSFLQKFQETTQQQSIPVTDSRIITIATMPLEKAAPKRALAFAAGILLGLFGGAGVALARELLVDVFHTPKQVELATGIPCLGILPLVTKKKKKKRVSALSAQAAAPVSENDWLVEYALDTPFSRFAETLRNIRVFITNARFAREMKVVGIVSAVPQEGKTTITANLGAIVSAAGARTLLIDADFRQRALSTALAPEAATGLLDALAEPSRLADFVRKRSRSGLDVLPCVLGKPFLDSAEMLGSAQMAELLAVARRTYDFVFIELPPIAPVVDAKAMGHLVDGFVFVVEWGKSKRDLVLESISEADMIRERLIGIVLNKADPIALQRNEAYKGGSFQAYYVE